MSRATHQEPSCQVCISNLPPDAPDVGRLHKILKKELHVEVLRCKIKGSSFMQGTTKVWKHSGYAYVHLATEESATYVKEQAESGHWKPWGRRVDVEYCQARGKPPVVLKGGTLEVGTVDLERPGMFYIAAKLPCVQMEVNLHTKKVVLLRMDESADPKGSTMNPIFKMEWLIRNMKAVGGPYDIGKGVGWLMEMTHPPHIYARFGDDRIWESSLQKELWVADDEDPWARTTDFTGGSLGLCRVFLVTFLHREERQLKSLCKDVFRTFPWVQQYDMDPEILQRNRKEIGVQHKFFFSVHSTTLPFNLRFLVSSLVLKGVLAYSKRESLDRVLREYDPMLAEAALRRMLRYHRMCYNPVGRFRRELSRTKALATVSASTLVSHALVRRITITPTTAYCYPEEMELSNRVIRHFSNFRDSFLRVTFTDEGWQKMTSFALNPPYRSGPRDVGRSDQKTEVYDRILTLVTKGFTLCGLHYEFLAASNSQFRDRSAWFYAGVPGSPALGEIQRWMGDFSSIKNVAKCLSRMGQCFSSAFHRKDVPRTHIEPIPDIVAQSEAFDTQVLTDGVGKMTPEFALQLAGEMSQFFRGEAGACLSPTAYQIRYAGYKGVLGVWPREAGQSAELSFRPSMDKFVSSHCDLEVVNWSRFMPAHLNRQIIILLTALGVKSPVFYHLQQNMISSLDRALEDGRHALWLLETSCLAEEHHVASTMLRAGWEPKVEPHLRGMLLAMRAVQLQTLKTKAKIFVPKGRWLLGTVDETKTLQPGECFIRVSGPPDDAKPGTPNLLLTPPRVITGQVFFGKNPCLHPGDLRFLRAVDVPALHFKVDELILPVTGLRSHANEASGSDFDGDVYFVSWDERLIPENAVSAEPMDYEPATPLVEDVQTRSIRRFFVDNMSNDSVGIICNAHLVHADLSPVGALDDKCLQLAKQAALSFDFPKTGIPGRMPPDLRVTKYPDFMEKEEGKETYRSSQILGCLFRVVKRKVTERVEKEGPLVEAPTDRDSSRFWWPSELQAAAAFDPELVVEGYEGHLEEAWALKRKWDTENLNFMHYFGIPTEAELVTGFIVHISRHFRSKQGSVMEHVRLALKKRRAEFKELLYKQEEEEEEEKEKEEEEAGNDTDSQGTELQTKHLPDVCDSESGGQGEGEGEGVASEYAESALSAGRGGSEDTSEAEGMLTETTDSKEGSERVHPLEPVRDEPTATTLKLEVEGEVEEEGTIPGRDEKAKDGLGESLEPLHPSCEASMRRVDGGGDRGGGEDAKGGHGVVDGQDDPRGGEREAADVAVGVRDMGRSASLGQEEEELLAPVDEAHGLAGEEDERDKKLREAGSGPQGEGGGANQAASKGEGQDLPERLGPGVVDGVAGDGRDGRGEDENVRIEVGGGQVDVGDGEGGDSGGGEGGGGGDERERHAGEDEVHDSVMSGGRQRQWSSEIFSMEVRRRASAWYYVSYHPEWLKKRAIDLEGGEEVEKKSVRPVLLSFPWVGDTVLAAIKKEKSRKRRVRVE